MSAISVNVVRDVTVKASIDFVFEVLADVPRSVSHFPRVDQLVDLGGNAFRWEMEPIGTKGFSHQVVYACAYKPDAGQHKVTWTPVDGVGNSVIRGSWTLKTAGSGTAIHFETSGDLDVPVPRLLRRVVEPFVAHEFEGSIDTYLDNLTKTFGGRQA